MPERGIPRRISGGCAAGHILYKELNAERLLKCLKGSVRDIGVIMLIVIKALDGMISSGIIALFLEVAAGFTVYCAVITLLRDSFVTDLLMGKILKRKRRAA